MSTSEIHVRPASLADLKTISEFAAELLVKWDARATTADAYQVYDRIVKSPLLGIIFVAEQNGAICGFVYASYELRAEFAGETMDMVEMYVEQSSRNKGVGRRLLKELIRHARERNIGRVTCQVHPGNSAIERALESTGFDPERRTLWGLRL